MATYVYSGKLTDYGGAPFPNAVPELWVMPSNSGFASGAVLAEKRIPVTVAADGTFTVTLHASSSVVPEVLYSLACNWIASGERSTWSDWAVFRAAAGGGSIGNMTLADLPPWSISYGYGPPPPEMNGLYIDITGPEAVLYGPDRGI